MTETTLEVSDPNDVLALFGARDQHLRAIRSQFDVTITHRDGKIRIAGDHDAVRAAARVLRVLRTMVQRHGGLSGEEVERVLAEERQDRRESLKGEVVTRVEGVEGVAGGAAGVTFSRGMDIRAGEIDIHSAGRRIRPRTEGQAVYVAAIRDHDLTFCSGPAGTGKTYLAVACAVEALKEHRIRKIVLVRPAVEAGENLGFLPGDLRAKLNPYLRPLLDAINEMVDYDQARSLMEQDVIEVIPLAYMRGRTLNDAFIILDEAQNTTVAQMKMFLTRMGERSRMVVSGDVSQVDLPRGVQSGLRDALMRLQGIPEIGMIRLQKTDIVRHKLVQQIVRAYESLDS